MRRRTLSIACAGAAALGLILWLTSSRAIKAPAAQTSDQRAAAMPPTAAGDSPASAPAPTARKSTLTKIDPTQRAQLQAAIARSRATRESSVTSTPAQAKTSEKREVSEEIQGELRERIRAHIREVQPLLAECYELELARKPQLAGDLRLRFTIDGEPAVGGIVSESEVTGGSLAEEKEMVTCVRETLFTAKFDAPEAGGMIVVEYPFAFSTK